MRLIQELKLKEATRAKELALSGFLQRLWRSAPEGDGWENVGIWHAKDESDLNSALESLPLYPWATISVTPLATHPSDPGAQRAT